MSLIWRTFVGYYNLSTISKIFERLALARLKPHISLSSNYCQLIVNSIQPRQSLQDSRWCYQMSVIDDGSVVAMMSLYRHIGMSVWLCHTWRACAATAWLSDTCCQWIRGYLTGRSFTVYYVAIICNGFGWILDVLFFDALVMQSAVLAIVNPSVCLSVRHTLALCQYDSCYDRGVFIGG